MENLNFRLQLDGLEDRTIPSVTPSMVITAYVHQNAVKDELKQVIADINDAKTSQTISFLATHLRERANSSQADFKILATYLHDLQVQIAANPGDAKIIGYAGQIAMAEYQASINAAYAEFYALAYGAPPRVPPPPPPSIDNGPNFGNTSNLPFSLTDSSWQTIANGVRTWDVTTGTGTTLANGTQFHADYTGYLTNGTVFDSSAKSGVLSGSVGTGLITGFSAGLVGMKVGGVRRIDIPASQAYGANPPNGSGIPANAELVFEVTLLSSP